MITIKWSLCLIFFLSNSILVISSPAKPLCLPDQRDALLEFKNEFYVQSSYEMKSYAQTETWRNNTDCCSWDGVSCDPKTGVVVELDLGSSDLNGPLRSNSSLFRLHHLQSLDLAYNNLSGILPDSIGNLKYLKLLSLRRCKFIGKIPSSLGNLSYLSELDLSFNDLTGEIPDWMGNLKYLKVLRLRYCNLFGKIPSAFGNLSNLAVLSLSDNDLTSERPDSMGNLNRLTDFQLMLLNMSSLTIIDLGFNQFRGMLPSNMSSLSKLRFFYIRENSFSGTIPSSLFMIPSLTYLDLGTNNFSGPLEIGNISSQSKLRDLFIGENNFNPGIVDLSIFSRLLSLSYLDLSGINLKISSTLHFPSAMGTLILSSCNISEFPKFLQNQTSLYDLDISANQIEGQVPEWLWRLPTLMYVNISQNSFNGFEGPADVIQRCGELDTLDISSNTFQNPFPLLPRSTSDFFSSDNQFSGDIPREICEIFNLNMFVLSNNKFSGSIPRCFKNLSLSVLHLRNNSLSGVFQEESISVVLGSLDIGHNFFSGELPKSLINCSRLEFLNVEDNIINGTFPLWLRLLPNLQILVLRSNEFYGPISSPKDSVSFPKLRIFDISDNRFTGVLPSEYFVGWTAMSSVHPAMSSVVNIVDSRMSIYERHYHKSVALINKGLKMELVGSGFTIYKTIDVSRNRFEGDIPESIGLLKELIVLNMSNNDFTGHIPPSLSNLSNLESLDLSQNRLSGSIPPELGKLTFLERMNFSYNMLEGPIPQATQIQSQNSSSFTGNPNLCGVPLQETCGGEEEATKQEQAEAKEEEEQVLSWIAAAIGYVPGVVCGLTIGHILTS